MLKFFRKLFRFGRTVVVDVPVLITEPPPHNLFLTKTEQGTSVLTEVYDKNRDEKISVILQRRITSSCVQDGKLKPFAWIGIKRRGGKQQLQFLLTLETAEALETALSQAIETARALQHRRFVQEQLLQGILHYMKTQDVVVSL